LASADSIHVHVNNVRVCNNCGDVSINVNLLKPPNNYNPCRRRPTCAMSLPHVGAPAKLAQCAGVLGALAPAALAGPSFGPGSSGGGRNDATPSVARPASPPFLHESARGVRRRRLACDQSRTLLG